MAKVHITLVGGQPTPVYLGIKYAQPEKVVLIHSHGTLDVAERIMNEFTEIDVTFEVLPPVDLHEIEKKAEQMLHDYENDLVTLNISGGTKPWSYYFSNVFEKHGNTEQIYVDQNCFVWNLTTKKHTKLQCEIDIQFRLSGNPLEKYTKISEYSEEDFKIIKDLEDIRSFNYEDFRQLLSVFPSSKNREWNHLLKNSKKTERFQLPSGSYVEFLNPNNVCICLNTKRRGQIIKNIHSPHAVKVAFNTTWFELKVAKVLSKWNKTKAIYHSCRFVFNQALDKNEVDIIVDTGSKLLFVECKTQINDTTNIDKFRTVVKNYGGMGSKALFVTDGELSDMARQKCEDSGILSFSLNENHLGMSTETALFMLLDSALFNINAK